MTNPSEGQRATLEGRGSYNSNSALQASGAVAALSLFAEAASEIPLDDTEGPIVFADYGSSQGRNSLAPLRAAITELRSRIGPQRPIIVAHVDQPANDFATLFDVVDTATGSYISDDGNVVPCAVGRSFYRNAARLCSPRLELLRGPVAQPRAHENTGTHLCAARDRRCARRLHRTGRERLGDLPFPS
jgi:hypothetical protein